MLFNNSIICNMQKHIEKASETLKQCMSVCSKHRKHVSITQNIGKMVKKINYDAYTNGNVLHMHIKQHAFAYLMNIHNNDIKFII